MDADIIRMAREAQQEQFSDGGGHWFQMEVADLVRFAALVRAAEREACARIAERSPEKHWCVATIRARGEK